MNISLPDTPFLEAAIVFGNDGPHIEYKTRTWGPTCVAPTIERVHSDHNPNWEIWAQDEIEHIKSIMPQGLIVDAEHVGSTSIPGIRARGCIAINFAVTNVGEAKRAAKILIDRGYEVRVDIIDVYSLMGTRRFTGVVPFQRVEFEIYFITKLQRQWHFKKAFRDYLRAHPLEAKVYEQTKLDIWKSCGGDSELYRHNKSEFVMEILRKCGYAGLYLKEKMEDGDYTPLQGAPENLMTSWYGPNVFWRQQ